MDRRGESDEVLLGKIGPGMEASLVAKEILTYLISHGGLCFFLMWEYLNSKIHRRKKYIYMWC